MNDERLFEDLVRQTHRDNGFTETIVWCIAKRGSEYVILETFPVEVSRRDELPDAPTMLVVADERSKEKHFDIGNKRWRLMLTVPAKSLGAACAWLKTRIQDRRKLWDGQRLDCIIVYDVL